MINTILPNDQVMEFFSIDIYTMSVKCYGEQRLSKFSSICFIPFIIQNLKGIEGDEI